MRDVPARGINNLCKCPSSTDFHSCPSFAIRSKDPLSSFWKSRRFSCAVRASEKGASNDANPRQARRRVSRRRGWVVISVLGVGVLVLGRSFAYVEQARGLDAVALSIWFGCRKRTRRSWHLLLLTFGMFRGGLRRTVFHAGLQVWQRTMRSDAIPARHGR
jgi:hypothetical protein